MNCETPAAPVATADPYALRPENRVAVKPNQWARIRVPFSEVCMHMRVAGDVMDAQLLARTYGGGDRVFYSVQLWTLDGRPFSGPITYGEAGFYRDGETFTTYGQIV